jgi:hypothetical protein
MILLEISALRRSGHHGVIKWILEQIPGNYVFLNNCLIYRDIKCRDAIQDIMFKGKQEKWPQDINNPFRILIKGKKDYKFLIYNLEDEFTDLSFDFLDNIGFEKKIKLLVLRDPFNNFASRYLHKTTSRYNKSLKNLMPWKEVQSLWKDHAQAFLSGNFVNVSYNKWFVDRDYRKGISSELGLCFNDDGLSQVPIWGDGSSVDGMKFNGCAQQMNVLNRYQLLWNNPDYWKLFEDEIIDLSERVFDFNPFINSRNIM